MVKDIHVHSTYRKDKKLKVSRNHWSSSTTYLWY